MNRSEKEVSFLERVILCVFGYCKYSYCNMYGYYYDICTASSILSFSFRKVDYITFYFYEYWGYYVYFPYISSSLVSSVGSICSRNAIFYSTYPKFAV